MPIDLLSALSRSFKGGLGNFEHAAQTMALKHQQPKCALYWSSHGAVCGTEVPDRFINALSLLTPAPLSILHRIVTYDAVVFSPQFSIFCMAGNMHVFTQRPSDDGNEPIHVSCSFDTELGFGVLNRLLPAFERTKLPTNDCYLF